MHDITSRPTPIPCSLFIHTSYAHETISFGRFVCMAEFCLSVLVCSSILKKQLFCSIIDYDIIFLFSAVIQIKICIQKPFSLLWLICQTSKMMYYSLPLKTITTAFNNKRPCIHWRKSKLRKCYLGMREKLMMIWSLEKKWRMETAGLDQLLKYYMDFHIFYK